MGRTTRSERKSNLTRHTAALEGGRYALKTDAHYPGDATPRWVRLIAGGRTPDLSGKIVIRLPEDSHVPHFIPHYQKATFADNLDHSAKFWLGLACDLFTAVDGKRFTPDADTLAKNFEAGQQRFLAECQTVGVPEDEAEARTFLENRFPSLARALARLSKVEAERNI